MASKHSLKWQISPRGRWHWDGAYAQGGNCHMSENKEDGGGKREASSAILPLNRGKQQREEEFLLFTVAIVNKIWELLSCAVYIHYSPAPPQFKWVSLRCNQLVLRWTMKTQEELESRSPLGKAQGTLERAVPEPSVSSLFLTKRQVLCFIQSHQSSSSQEKRVLLVWKEAFIIFCSLMPSLFVSHVLLMTCCEQWIP